MLLVILIVYTPRIVFVSSVSQPSLISPLIIFFSLQLSHAPSAYYGTV